MAEMKFLCLYFDYKPQLLPLSDAARGKLLMAMIDYAQTGVLPEFSGPAKYAWPALQSQIDRDKKKYRATCEANRIKGAKGGRPRKKAAAIAESQSFSQKAEKPKENENEKEKENEKENDKEKEKERERENIKDSLLPPLPFFPPSLKDVSDYCKQAGLSMDPEKFVDHYTSNGWMVGCNPMKDWQAAARNWNRKEHNFGKNEVDEVEYLYGTVL